MGWRGLAFALALLPAAAAADPIVSARLIDPTDRYDHAILGDALEWAGLEMTLASGQRLRVTLPGTRVFEDVAARVVDADGDGLTEVIAVETDLMLGASLAVYDAAGKRAATPFIGQTHRWLAPAGVGDFDGDGRPEIAYVDRPHLLRELVFLRLTGGHLAEIARIPGLTNHRIGDSAISGGLRRCGGRDSLILADTAWARTVEVTWQDGRPVATDIGPIDRLSAALTC
jgi:FG-GAP-like repeat